MASTATPLGLPQPLAFPAFSLDHAYAEHDTSHCLFACFVDSAPTSAFFDTGTTSCYIEETCVPPSKLVAYKRPLKLKGIGGKEGPVITHFVTFSLAFAASIGITTSFAITCSVCPDGTFPGQLTLGRRAIHTLGVSHLPGCDDIRLLNLPGKPLLSPSKDATAWLKQSSFAVQSAEENSKYDATEVAARIAAIRRLKKQFAHSFEHENLAGSTTSATHGRVVHDIKIDNPDVPVKCAPRRYSPIQRKFIAEYLDAALKAGFIQRSNSPHASPAHVVGRKKPERFCVDYRELNRRTVKDGYPLPNVKDEVQRAAGHKYYVRFDLKSGFYHVGMSREAQQLSAFVVEGGHYEYLVMPFGLTNAPATFQRIVDDALRELRDIIANMIDDVITWGETIEECAENARRVLRQFEKYGFRLNPKKCEWFVLSTKFLGHIVDRHGVRADPDKIRAILNRPPPKTVTDVRSFLNQTNYFRDYVDYFSTLAGPLYELTSLPGKKVPVTLSSSQLDAWRRTRNALITLPVLARFDNSLPCVIDVDSSGSHTGGVLLQPSSSVRVRISQPSLDTLSLRPIAYTSHKLTPAQTRYSAQEREALAIVQALQEWREWIEGCEIWVRTDHESLATLRKKRDLPRRMQRFVDIFEHFDPHIVYRKGKENTLADWLSRPPAAATTAAAAADSAADAADGATTAACPSKKHTTARRVPVEPADPPPAVQQAEPQQPKKLWRSDPDRLLAIDLQVISDFLAHGSQLPRDLSENWVRKHFAVHDGKLYRVRDSHLLLVNDFQTLVATLSDMHQRDAHCSVGTLLRSAGQSLWHPDLILAAQTALTTCSRCQVMRRPPDIHELGRLIPIVAPTPFSRWGMDHSGPVYHGQQSAYLCTAIEYATSLGAAVLTPSQNAASAIDLLSRLIMSYGQPKELITDNGSAFASANFAEFLKIHGIKWHPTKPYRPQSNGKCERFNGTLKEIFGHVSSAHPHRSVEWVLNQALLTYNRRQGLSGYSPFFLALGVRSDSPAEAEYVREPTEEEESAQVADMVRILVPERDSARERVATGKATRDTLRAYLQEDKARLRVYAKGDWVLRQRKRNHKGEPFYDGPYVVNDSLPDGAYQLRTPAGVVLYNRYHGQQLFPAYVLDGHPVRSLWYGNKRMLERERKRLGDGLKRFED